MNVRQAIKCFMAVLIFSVFGSAVVAQPATVAIKKLTIHDSISKSNQRLIQRLNIEQKLSEALVDSGRFTTLARGSEELREDGSLPDYIFEPRVTHFSAYRKYEQYPGGIPVYDRTDVGSISISLGVMASKDGAIKFEEIAENHFQSKKELRSENEPTGGRPSDKQLADLVDKAIAQLFDSINSKINPVTIYSRNGDTILLDRGADRGLKKDVVMIVYSPPEIWKNPHTGVTRRLQGHSLGKVKITRVQENISEAKIIEEEKTGDKHIDINCVLQFERK